MSVYKQQSLLKGGTGKYLEHFAVHLLPSVVHLRRDVRQLRVARLVQWQKVQRVQLDLTIAIKQTSGTTTTTIP